MHTAGPWVASDHHSGMGWRIETDAPGYHNDGWIIASEMLGPDAADNARLIAAAPDLLAVAQYAEAILADVFEGKADPVTALDAISDLAKPAIARATGAGA